MIYIILSLFAVSVSAFSNNTQALDALNTLNGLSENPSNLDFACLMEHCGWQLAKAAIDPEFY